MIFITFHDNTHGEIDLEESEFAQLLCFARKGVRIHVPIMHERRIAFVDILDIRRNKHHIENIDYAQLSKLGSKTTFSR